MSCQKSGRLIIMITDYPRCRQAELKNTALKLPGTKVEDKIPGILCSDIREVRHCDVCGCRPNGSDVEQLDEHA